METVMFEKKYTEDTLDYLENMIIYSKPKMGKTEIISRIPDCGICDIEGGSGYVKGYKYLIKDPDNNPVQTLKNLDKFLDWCIKEKPHKYMSFDTMTYFEDCCVVQATYEYMNSVMGKNFNKVSEELIKKYPELAEYKGVPITHESKYWQSVTSLPDGAGYLWVRETFKRYFNKMKSAASRKIFVCHIKDKFLDGKLNKTGVDVQGRDLDLTGKLKMITSSFVDGIAYLNRGTDGNTYLSFQSHEAVAEGSRLKHLSGKNVLIGEWDKETHDFKSTHWDKIYSDLK